MESSVEDFDVGLDVDTENDEEWSRPELKFINLEGNRIAEFEHLTNILKQGYYKCKKKTPYNQNFKLNEVWFGLDFQGFL